MDENRSVHDVLRELTGGGDSPGAAVEALRAAGHDLPGDLVAEAVASFADTAPAAVAEHLSPFTTAYGPEGLADPAGLDAAELLPDGLALLLSAPAVGPSSGGEALADDEALDDEAAGAGDALDFGAGAGARDDDVVEPGAAAGPSTARDEPADDELVGHGPVDGEPLDDGTSDDMTGADLAGIPLLPQAPENFTLGTLGSGAPDETFDPAELDAADGEDPDLTL